MKTSSMISGQRGFYNFAVGLPFLALYGLVAGALLSDDGDKVAPTPARQTEVQLLQAGHPDEPIAKASDSAEPNCGMLCAKTDILMRIDP